MENRLNRFIKVAIALFAVLLLGVIGGFVTTVSAEEIDDTMLVETTVKKTYIFYPNGYTVDDGDLIEFTGTYILTGSASHNVTFVGNGNVGYKRSTTCIYIKLLNIRRKVYCVCGSKYFVLGYSLLC